MIILNLQLRDWAYLRNKTYKLFGKDKVLTFLSLKPLKRVTTILRKEGTKHFPTNSSYLCLLLIYSNFSWRDTRHTTLPANMKLLRKSFIKQLYLTW